ncbi:MAG: triose-phosphate isomerase [Alphaproteobacteria bacterium]|nr:MAG: triose-phosphate isomerase [Alphaproteobacteria bacterium]
MTARRPIVAGNWKMHGTFSSAASLTKEVMENLPKTQADGPQTVVCAPFPHLLTVGQLSAGSDLHLGAQDCSDKVQGAYTGDVSATMLMDIGCSHVIVGHSERRSLHGETSALVAAKAAAAQAVGLIPIICVGETEAQYRAGSSRAVVEQHLSESLPSGATALNTVIAYEPVWAIGTGLTPSLEEIAAIHRAIRDTLGALGADMRILYGGSVKPDNAAAILALDDVDGALVGGASLKASEFIAIVQAAHNRV